MNIQIFMNKPIQYKTYGSIPHLYGSKIDNHDKYITEGQSNICTLESRSNDLITVTLKMDGSCVGVVRLEDKTLIATTKKGYLAKWVEPNYIPGKYLPGCCNNPDNMFPIWNDGLKQFLSSKSINKL